MYPWVNPKDLDTIMEQHGYGFYKFGPRHNRTDGDEDRLYMRDGKIFRLYGNRWDYRTFKLNGKPIDLTADLNILNGAVGESLLRET